MRAAALSSSAALIDEKPPPNHKKQVTTLVFEYTLANAAVARTFSAYLAQLVSPKNGPVHTFTIEWQGLDVDFVALACVIFNGAMLMFSTKASDIYNLICTGAQMLTILVLIIAGFIKANPANLTPFAPNGIRGIFSGASFVFFRYDEGTKGEKGAGFRDRGLRAQFSFPPFRASLLRNPAAPPPPPFPPPATPRTPRQDAGGVNLGCSQG